MHVSDMQYYGSGVRASGAMRSTGTAHRAVRNAARQDAAIFPLRSDGVYAMMPPMHAWDTEASRLDLRDEVRTGQSGGRNELITSVVAMLHYYYSARIRLRTPAATTALRLRRTCGHPHPHIGNKDHCSRL